MAFNNEVNANQSGFQSITSGGVWNGRTLVAGSGISITNTDGTGGNPTISATSPGGGAAWTLVQSITVNNQATITFTTGLSSYNELIMLISNVSTNAADAWLLELSTDAGSTWAVNTSGVYVGSGNGVIVPSSTSFTIIGFSNGAPRSAANGFIHIINNNGNSMPIRGIHSEIDGLNISSVAVAEMAILNAQTSSQITGIRLNRAANLFSSGQVDLWGR